MADTPAVCSVESVPAVEYRPIVGYEGYRVGSDGSVWSRFSRVRVVNRYAYVLGNEWTRRRAVRTRKGYLVVNLCDGHGRAKIKRVHVLVLEAFVGPKPAGCTCAHYNGVRDDNRLANLRWDTPANNAADRLRHSTMLFGERNPKAKLAEADIRAIRSRRLSGESSRVLAREYGVSACQIRNIVGRREWKHLA